MDITEAYTLYSGAIHGYIAKMVLSQDLADDLMQDTFEHAARSWSSVRVATVKPWLYRIAHNLVVSYLRRASVVAWSSLDAAEHVFGLDEVEQCGEREHIELTLKTLKPKYANVLRLCLDGGNLPYAVLAQHSGESTQNFKMHVSRARKLFAVAYVQQAEQKGA